jgi:chemotaxis protein CheX
MNPQDLLVTPISKAAEEVFSTMLGSELSPGEASMETGDLVVDDGVVALVGLAGPWAGTGCVSCSPAAACRICSLMLMTEAPSVNEEVLDAIAEITNMIIGSVKNDLEPKLGSLGLSIPTVVFGRNFRTRSAGTPEWTVVRFPWEGEQLTVKVFLAPVEKVVHSHFAAGNPCTIQI